MSFVPNIFTRGDFIPKLGLEAWYAADHTDTAASIVDASGKSPDIVREANPGPTLTANVINGLPSMVFDGSTNYPLRCTRAFVARHVFTVAAYADAAFPSGEPGFAGLVSGLFESATRQVLVGDAATTKFFDFGPTRTYRRRDVPFAQSDMQASFSNAMSVFEISDAAGWNLDGIQIGRQTDYANRRWKGPWCETLIYNRLLSETERFDVYAYLAMKYRLWRRTAAGLDVWPFQPNVSYQVSHDKLVLSSTAVSGRSVARSKTSAKRGYDLAFETRREIEADTARAFWNAKYPATSFVYRDYSRTTPLDVEVKFAGGISEKLNGWNDVDYAIQIGEV